MITRSSILFPVLILSSFFSFSQSNTTKETFVVPANKAYAEPFVEGRGMAGVSIPVGYPESKGTVSKWNDINRSVVWYLYQKQGSYDLSFQNTVTAGKTLEFELKVSSNYEIPGFQSFSKRVKFEGNGTENELFATNIEIPTTGYFRYELRPITDPQSAITIKSLIFKSLKKGGQVNHTNYQSSPSVHLSFSSTASTSKKYDWIYEEILVPEGGDPLATYYMSLGFYRGYMGIQTNSAKERRVLFSVWDSKDAEHDSTITKEDFVSLVDKDEATTVNNFGGEGTGGQSFVNAGWKTGQPVKFLMNVLQQSNNSVVLSAWYKLENEDWKYVATWRAPKEQKMFDGFYSFIENYGHSNGQLRREAYYYNAWGREVNGNWVNFNKVRFSNTDGKDGQRVDYEQGVSTKYKDRFYMASGGYTPTVKTGNETPLAKTRLKLDLALFEKRVTKALRNEKQVLLK